MISGYQQCVTDAGKITERDSIRLNLFDYRRYKGCQGNQYSTETIHALREAEQDTNIHKSLEKHNIKPGAKKQVRKNDKN